MLTPNGAANTSGKSVTTLIVSTGVFHGDEVVSPRLDRRAPRQCSLRVLRDLGGVGARVVVPDRGHEPPVPGGPLVRDHYPEIALPLPPHAPQANASRHSSQVLFRSLRIC